MRTRVRSRCQDRVSNALLEMPFNRTPMHSQLVVAMFKFETTQSKINEELKSMHGGAIPAAGVKTEARGLNSAQQKVLGYATQFMAQHAADVHLGVGQPTRLLESRELDRLVRGTETMDYTRSKLNMGRGNVDGTEQAIARSRIAYKYTTGHDEAKHAAIIEELRAGNCDHHGKVSAVHAGGNLPNDNEFVSKVRVPGHVFTELRGTNGQTAISDTDVIVDSWSSSSHAVLREDSRFGSGMLPGRSNNLNLAFTHYTKNKDQGAQTAASKNRHVNKLQNVMAAKLQDEVDSALGNARPFKMWDPTPIWSENLLKRQITFDGQSKLTRSLQTAFTARQLGANIKGATQLANEGGFSNKGYSQFKGISELTHDLKQVSQLRSQNNNIKTATGIVNRQ